MNRQTLKIFYSKYLSRWPPWTKSVLHGPTLTVLFRPDPNIAMSNIYFRLNFSEFHGTPNKTDSPVPYPRTDIGFEPADDTLVLICKTSLNGSCVYTESHGELSISGWDDDLLEDYSVTLGKACTNGHGCPDLPDK